ncbi:G-type lectin S-receptor-like serine/threonine-protein kinase [Carex littledalei]|uniref:non-specific serine/threonine protein kinase n=1 Tax=Carex littledalei TaxID=544730 RepID=A0A833V0V1_9POAL|nr:G-type lectin S-receptor-like serine/threonine-protein kinase [Carex littledalei]
MSSHIYIHVMRRRLLYFSYSLLLIFLLLPHWVVGDQSSTTTKGTLSQTGSLSDGQTLISLNNTFELGFFGLNGSSYRYVGIWYHKIAYLTPVWIANRNNPLVDKSGVLLFNNNGELVITDVRGGSFTVAYGLGRNNVEATILDSGNLVLREISNLSSIIWQSFDYPTNTWLPGMKLGVIEGQNRLITSWRSSIDPAAGDFSFGLDPKKTGTFLIWKEDKVIWTSGRWQEIPEFSALHFNFVSNSEEMYYTYSSTNFSRFVIDSGQIEEIAWLDSPHDQWILFWAQPRTNCDVYNMCGAFGLCDPNNVRFCTCVQGFTPASQSDWNNGDTSGGCIRQSNLECSTSPVNITFLATPVAYTLPPNSKAVINAEGIEQCEAVCLGECNCTVYAFSEICYVWYGDIIDVKANITASVLYFRENASSLASAGKHSQDQLLQVGDYAGYRNNNQLELEHGIDGEITLWKTEEKDVQAWDLWKEERWFQLVDQSFVNNCPTKEVRRCIHVALTCVQDNATDRPTMSEVVTMLGNDSMNLPEPKQPAFFKVRVAIGDDIDRDLNKSCSVNIVTNSIPDGR